MSSSLFKSTGVVSFMTLLSRVLGFVRDVTLAVLFGAGASMDAFLVAFKIPNFMRRMFAEGAFNQSFVPVLSATRNEESDADVRELVDVVSGTLGLILLAITVVGVVAAPVVIFIFAPGFADSPSQFALSVDLLRWTFPYLLFISLTAFAGSVLNTYRQFAVPAFTPVLLNICMIGAALWVVPYFHRPVMALAMGVFAAGLVQLAFQLPFLVRLGLLPRPRWGWAHEKVRRIIRLMLPILFGASVTQINLLLDTILASMLASGSISWLYYSDRLMQFPLGVFAIAIGTVILPSLSKRHVEQSPQAFSGTLDWALRTLAVIGIPAMIGLLVLAGPLITTLFNYRSFKVHDVLMTRYSLQAYAFGFMGFSLVKVLVPGFFSREDSRTPVRCAVVSMAATMMMNVSFVGILVWLAFPAPHTGLALATSLGAFINAGMLFWYLHRDRVYRPLRGWLKLSIRVALASGLMAAVLVVGKGDLAAWFAADVFVRAAWLAALITGGVVVYFAVLFSAGFRPRHLNDAGAV